MSLYVVDFFFEMQFAVFLVQFVSVVVPNFAAFTFAILIAQFFSDGMF